MGTRICSEYGKEELKEERGTPEKIAIPVKENISQHFDYCNKSGDNSEEYTNRYKNKLLTSNDNQNLYSVYRNENDFKNLKSSIFDNEDIQEENEPKNKQKYDKEINTYEYIKNSDAKNNYNYDFNRNKEKNLNDYFSDEFKVNIADIGSYSNNNINTNDNNNIISNRPNSNKKLDFTFKTSVAIDDNIENKLNNNNFNNNYRPEIYKKYFNNEYIKNKFTDFLNSVNFQDKNFTRNKNVQTKENNYLNYLYEMIKAHYIKNQIKKISEYYLKHNSKIKKNIQNLEFSKADKILKDSCSHFGIKYYKNGGMYIGGINNDKCNGWGKFTNNKGDIVMGYFKDDYLNGYTLYTLTSSKSKKNKFFDCINSDTEININDNNENNILPSSSFEGYLSLNRPDGTSVEKFFDGSKFIGEQKEGIREGIGTYIWDNGNQYKGMWKGGVMEGYGIFFDTSKKSRGTKIYEGEWKNGKMDGVGMVKWEDGRKYFGYFKNDLRDKFGIYMWKNPFKIYMGFWKEGKQYGLGKLFTSLKRKLYIWNKGKRVKEIKNEQNFWENIKLKINNENNGNKFYDYKEVYRFKYFFDMTLEEIIDYMINLD